jgi:hypothetical protein
MYIGTDEGVGATQRPIPIHVNAYGVTGVTAGDIGAGGSSYNVQAGVRLGPLKQVWNWP